MIKKVTITIVINNSCDKIFKSEVSSYYNFLQSPERQLLHIK